VPSRLADDLREDAGSGVALVDDGEDAHQPRLNPNASESGDSAHNISRLIRCAPA
jgi:hypothetical protein